MHRIAKLFVVLATLPLLSCAADSPKFRNLVFTPNDPTYGLVIFGIAAQPDYQNLDALQTWQIRWDQWPAMTATDLMQEDPKLTRTQADAIVQNGLTDIFAQRPPLPIDDLGIPEPAMEGVRYFIRAATAETHYLKEIRVERLNNKQLSRNIRSPETTVIHTTYARDGASTLLNANTEQLIKANAVPNFRIKPGEIVYIGDFYIDLAKEVTQRSRIVKYELNEDAARRHLALHPNIKGTMRTQKLTVRLEPAPAPKAP